MSTPNPYAAPRAPVADADVTSSSFIPGGRAVPGSHGGTWVSEAWDLFKRQPLMWVLFAIVGVVILLAFMFLPIVGQIAQPLLTPVFLGGVMIGCSDLERGRRLELAHLFAGFRVRFGSLVLVGLIWLGLTVVAGITAAVLGGGAGMWAQFGRGADPSTMAATGLLMTLIMVALLIPISMAMWFAPPLVLFHAQGPVEAMKNSFLGCVKNILPFLIYSLVVLVFALLASIPLGLGWLVFGPVMVASLYTSYRDIFLDQRSTSPEPR
jgi:uncharacterized membrane protein